MKTNSSFLLYIMLNNLCLQNTTLNVPASPIFGQYNNSWIRKVEEDDEKDGSTRREKVDVKATMRLDSIFLS